MVDLILPGLNGSGRGHWQDWWLGSGRDAILVEQADWDHPRLSVWLRQFELAVARHPGAILVAHSLACSLVGQFAAANQASPVRAALLVAPADIDDRSWSTPVTAAFGPMPMARLPFPAIVVASRNDPYVGMDRAREFAGAWGAELVDIGAKGHINPDNGFGPWRDGLALAERLEERAAAPTGR